MECGISTASLFLHCNVEDALLEIAKTGCKTTEVFLNTSSEYESEFVDLIAERVEQSGLKVHSLHAMSTQFEPQLFSLHARQRADAIKVFRQVLSAAKRLRAGIYVMHGPAHMSGMVKNVDMSRLGPIVRDLCDLASDYGVTLTWENVSWCLFCEPEFARRILDASKSDKLRFTLDIKQAARTGRSPFEYLNAMGDRIANVHICDYVQEERLKLCMPGQGAFDFRRLKQELLNHGYAGPLLIEVYSDLFRNIDELADCYRCMSRLIGSIKADSR